MPLFVKMVIVDPLLFPISSRRDNRGDVSAFQLGNQRGTVVTFIRQHVAIPKTRQQIRCRNDVVNLTPAQIQDKGVAKCVYYCVNLGRKTSPAAPESLFFLPPFAPAAC